MSMPDEFVIYRAEGKIRNGPNGALVSTDCPFMVRRFSELKNKSFQQVRRMIMDICHLSEATHELTLQHVLWVRNNPLAPPYNVLIDIVGEDSWRTFLSAAPYHVGGYKVYARWNVKKTRPASNGIDINDTTVPDEDHAVTDESDDGSWPTCKHDKPCALESSWDRPGERFYRCPLYMYPGADCKFIKWLDKPFPERAVEVIKKLQESEEVLLHQVENLNCELEELRRRNRKRSTNEASVSHGDKCSCSKSPCDLACRNRDEQTNPSQIPRLARDN